jgi:hypothetical protein
MGRRDQWVLVSNEELSEAVMTTFWFKSENGVEYEVDYSPYTVVWIRESSSRKLNFVSRKDYRSNDLDWANVGVGAPYPDDLIRYVNKYLANLVFA